MLSNRRFRAPLELLNLWSRIFSGRKSIQRRVFWSIGGIAVGILFLVNLTWLPGTINEIRESQRELQKLAIRSIGDQVEIFLREQERSLKTHVLLTRAALLEDDEAGLRVLAERFLVREPFIEEVGILDANGYERLRLSRTSAIATKDLSDRADAPLFQEVKTKDIYWGPVKAGESSEPRVTVAMPLRRSENRIFGAVFAVLNLKFLKSLTEEFQFGRTGRAYIVDQAGWLIASDEPSLTLNRQSFFNRSLVQQLGDEPGFASTALVYGGYENERRQYVLATGRFVPGPRWAVVVEQAESELFVPVKNKIWFSLWILLGGLAVAFGFARVLATRFTEPVTRLQLGVEAFGRGALDRRVDVESDDEIGDLARQFNHMADQLSDHQRVLQTKIDEKTKDLSSLYALTGPVSSAGDLEKVLDDVVDKIRAITGADAVSVRLVDEKDETELTLSSHSGFSDAYLRRKANVQELTLISGAVISTGQPIIVEDLSIDARFSGGPLEAEGFRSAAYFPLKCGGTVLGIIILVSREAGHLSPMRRELLGAFANQISVTIENTQLFENTQRAKEEALRRLNSLDLLVTATEKLIEGRDVDALAQDILNTIVTSFAIPFAWIGRAEPSGLVRPIYWVGDVKDYLEKIEIRWDESMLGRGPAGRAIRTGRPVVMDVAEDPGFAPWREAALAQGYCEVAAFPLMRADRPFGHLILYSREYGFFTEERVSLLQSYSNIASGVLENARLFEHVQRSLERIRALRDIDTATASTLNLHAVLAILLEKLDLALPFAAATIRLWNKRTGLLEPVACRHLDEKEWKASLWKGGRGLANVPFETKTPLVVRNAKADARVRDTEFYHKHNLTSYLGVPLIAKDVALGVLGFYTKEEHEFSAEEVEFLTALAGHAAIAIHNSQLYEEARAREANLQEANRMLAALHAVANAASQSLELDGVLHAAIERITEIFRFDATRIHIHDASSEKLILRASFETHPERFAAAQSFKLGQGVVGTVAQSGVPMIFEDLQTDTRYREMSSSRVSGRFGYQFFAVFPIKGKQKRLGTLTCIGLTSRTLSPGETQLLESLADQIALAIENSDLYETLRQKVEELQRKTTELEQANKGKDEFLSVMSHELRTPLNVMMGYAGLLQDRIFGVLNPDQDQALCKIVTHSKELLFMINDILQATSIQAEEVEARFGEVGVSGLLDELRAGYEIPLSKDVVFNWDYPSDLPTLQTDGDKLKHILQNLLNNAVKFTKQGEINLFVRSRPDAGMIDFQVSDTGIGIPDEDLPRIFEMFRQVDSSETRLYSGVGLGLYIVKKYTELLGGTVEVDSDPGAGSTFIVRLPLSIASDVARHAI